MLTCTKRYVDIPFAHRQHNHDGHCALIHGHNWSFEFEFSCGQLDTNGFVIDFGKLKWLKEWIADNFDHKLVLNACDPQGPALKAMLQSDKANYIQFADIKIVPNCGAEGLAEYLHKMVNTLMHDYALKDTRFENRGVRVVRVTVFEDSKNSATYRA